MSREFFQNLNSIFSEKKDKRKVQLENPLGIPQEKVEQISNHEKVKDQIEKKIKRIQTKKRNKIAIPKDEKLKKPKKVENVLIINPKKYQKDPFTRKIANVIIDTFYEFANITKVNGMYHLRRHVNHGFLRVLWSIIMISLLSFAATLIYLLYRRFLESPTRVTIAPPMGIHEIPFPGITICHPQNVMTYKSEEFLNNA
jgi:Amiloride-sensitive sodium channel